MEKAQCEHGVGTVACDECRYELGVVEVPPSIAAELLESSPVTRDEGGVSNLSLRCETGVDELRSTEVVALSPGLVRGLSKTLGQRVSTGDVLAVVYSGEFGEAKRVHVAAHQEKELAQARLDRIERVAKNVVVLSASLGKIDDEPPDPAAVAALVIGENKALLMDAANGYVRARAEWKRETERTRAALGMVEWLAGDGKKRKDELLAGEWRESLLTARAELRLARSSHERIVTLRKKGAASQREEQQASRDLSIARARFDGAVQAVKLWAERTEVETSTRLESARTSLQAALEEVRWRLEIARMEAGQEVERAQLKTAVTHRQLAMYGIRNDELESLEQGDSESFGLLEVRAPVDGVIIALHLAPGRSVVEGAPLFTIADLSTLWVWCDVYERDLQRLLQVKTPTAAVVSFEAFPGRAFPGSLDYISSVADPHTRTVRARVVTRNPAGLLRPGMFGTALVRLELAGSRLTVPTSAVLYDDGQAFVFKRWKGDFWTRRNVKVLERLEGRLEVGGDIASGDLVASRGAFYLKSDVLREKMGAGCAH